MTRLKANKALNSLGKMIHTIEDGLDSIPVGFFDSVNVLPRLNGEKLSVEDRKKLARWGKSTGMGIKGAYSKANASVKEATNAIEKAKAKGEELKINSLTYDLGGSALDYMKYRYTGYNGGLNYGNIAMDAGISTALLGAAGLAGYGAYSAISDD